MYWATILFICFVALALGGLIGVWPIGILIALVVAVGAVIWFVISGREGEDAAQLVSPSTEPTGEVRPPTAGTQGAAESANQRVEA